MNYKVLEICADNSELSVFFNSLEKVAIFIKDSEDDICAERFISLDKSDAIALRDELTKLIKRFE